MKKMIELSDKIKYIKDELSNNTIISKETLIDEWNAIKQLVNQNIELFDYRSLDMLTNSMKKFEFSLNNEYILFELLEYKFIRFYQTYIEIVARLSSQNQEKKFRENQNEFRNRIL